jgi:hypothetical protein
MPTIASETCPYLPLSEIARRIPPTKGKRPVDTSTITRWITKGVRAANGTVTRLEAKRFPGGWKVTSEALEEFIDRLTRAAIGEFEPVEDPAARMSPQRRRQYERAQREAKAIWG